MSRTPTQQTYEDLLTQQTSAAFITLYKIYVPNKTETYDCYYLCDNSVDITSSAMEGAPQTHVAFPIVASMPGEEDGKISNTQLTVTNVTRDLIDQVRSIPNPMLVEMVVINSKQPDVAVARTPCMTWRGLAYDDMSISGQLSYEDYISQAYPGELMAPHNYPGLFRD